MQVVAIIPTFNRRQFLKRLVKQLLDQSDNRFNLKIVVVVDGSNDGTIEMLRNLSNCLIVIEGDGTWWYTRSMNEGFRYAVKYLSPDYILTLNDDILIAENYLSEIQNLTDKNEKNSIFGSVGFSIGNNPKIVTSGNSWKNKFLGLYSNHIEFLKNINPKSVSGIHNSITLPGRGMLIPLNILKNLNYFDSKFKQYHSDSDFTLRAIKANYSVKISWDAKILVNLNETSPTTSFLNKSFKLLFYSYFDPVSRNYLPAKSRIIWRHGLRFSYVIRMILSVAIPFRNLVKTKWLI
jgi:GT2 family glycosyltransferase